ncbi:MAG: ATP-dependent DNA ligase [Actinomycetota bacterium]
MALPLVPPIAPMLARLVRELPLGDYLYEPKWDGFRAIAFRDGSEVDVRSRNQRPLARYFPEVVEAITALPAEHLVVDGEIVVVDQAGRFDFGALMTRLHPAASRVERLRHEAPATFIAFDLLAMGDEVVCDRPFEERRERLEKLFDPSDPKMTGSRIHLTPIATDPAVATEWLQRFTGGGVDGVVAKSRSLRYAPGRREMIKVKRELTAECVVAGFRWMWDRPVIGALLLGMHDDDGTLRHVGVASSFSETLRSRLLQELAPLVTPVEGHPWEQGFGIRRSPMGRLAGAAGRWAPEEMPMDWVPVRPELVCEVAYTTVDDHRFRFPAKFRRWRPDRDPASCHLSQLDESGGKTWNVPDLLSAR